MKINIFCIKSFVSLRTTQSPRFKFGINPPLIDGILNALPYELVSYKGYEKAKKWSMYSSNCKIFYDLYKDIS